MTTSQIIDALGGNAVVAQIAGVGPSAVSNWRRFGRFPPRLYLILERACSAKDVPCPRDLFESITESAA